MLPTKKQPKRCIRLVREHKDRLSLIDTDFYNLRTSINWLAEQDDPESAELLLGYLIANVHDEMSAQSLWKEAQKNKDLKLEVI